MGKRKPAALEEAVGNACGVVCLSVPVDDGFVAVADILVAAGAAADDRDRNLMVVIVLLFGRRSNSARRRNILVGAMINMDC
jgi:hypothetical protein